MSTRAHTATSTNNNTNNTNKEHQTNNAREHLSTLLHVTLHIGFVVDRAMYFFFFLFFEKGNEQSGV